MTKRKRSPDEKREKKERQREYMTLFIIWLHQNEMWEDIGTVPNEED
jgi:hypothetical protein